MTLEEFMTWAVATIPCTTYDGRPQETPTVPYCYLTSDGGVTARTGLDRAAQVTYTLYVVCVGETPEAARWVVGKVRGALNNAKPDGNHPLVEQPAGPELVEGTPTTGGERTSITLTYQLITRTQ